jgi:hypothetical protein
MRSGRDPALWRACNEDESAARNEELLHDLDLTLAHAEPIGYWRGRHAQELHRDVFSAVACGHHDHA